MKLSYFANLLAMPVVLAGTFKHERSGPKEGLQVRSYHDAQSSSHSAETVVETEVIIIWVNSGGGAATSTMAQATSVSSGAIATHSVTVGGSAGLVYSPSSISAAMGDMVIFTFMSQNHTATQSNFAAPCVKMEGGLDSGFMANANNSISPPPQMAMQVTVATPIWFYCRQKGHCGKGMVFSINPTASKSQDMFLQMAIAQNGTSGAATSATSALPTITVSSVYAPPAAATSMDSTTSSADATMSSSEETAAASMTGSSSGSPTAAAVSAASPTIATGSGTLSDGQCSCSCLCGMEAFASAEQGMYGFGGMSGQLPASAAMMS